VLRLGAVGPMRPGCVAAALDDQVSAKADRDRVGAAACLELREQVAHVRLHRLLGEEEALADLAVHETL
jgi:hypothetical protein